MMSYRIVLGMVIVVASATPGWAQRYTGQGAAVGGATGAVIGGLIGKQTDKTTGGALIGGAVGAVAGGMMGRSYDQELARQRRAYQQAQHARQHQLYVQQPVATSVVGVSVSDVLQMHRNRVSESVIIAQLHSRGIARPLEVSDIIMLHEQGISEAVITAMQTRRRLARDQSGRC